MSKLKQGRGGVEGPETMLGRGEREERGDLVDKKSLQDLVRGAK